MGERERYAIILGPEQLCCLLAIAEDAASSINSEEARP